MSLVRDIDSPTKPVIGMSMQNAQNAMPLKTFFMTLAAAIIIGTLVGWALGHGKAGAMGSGGSAAGSNSGTSGGLAKTAGVQDLKTFKDNAEGVLKEGGIEGEGSFHLVRPGGDSQNVYLTSSTIDLSPYVGKKVRVHGQTMAAQHAGWLMDVGFLELLQ